MTRLSSHALLLIVLLFVAAALSILRLNDNLLWYDEALSIYMSGGAEYSPVEPGVVIQRVAEDNAWPPLYNLLLALWGNMTGWSAVAGRMMSLLLGMLALAITYRMARELAGEHIGFLTMTLLASSGLFLHYAHDMRGYTLYVLLTSASVWLYRLLSTGKRDTMPVRVAFVLCLTGLLYTHYIASTTAVALGLYLLFFVKRDRRWWIILGLMLLSAALFIPWVWSAFQAVTYEAAKPRAIHPLVIVIGMLYGFSNALQPLLLVLLLHVALRIRGRTVGFVWFWLIVGLVLAFIFNIFTSYLFHIRHLMGLYIPVLLLMAVGINDVLKLSRWLGWGLLMVWVAVGFWHSHNDDFINGLPNQVMQIPAGFLETVENTAYCIAPDDGAVFYAAPPFVEWSYYRVFDHYLYASDLYWTQLTEMRHETWSKDNDYRERVEDFLENRSRIWFFGLVTLPRVGEYDTFQQILSENYTTCDSVTDANGVLIQVYTHKGSDSTCPIECMPHVE